MDEKKQNSKEDIMKQAHVELKKQSKEALLNIADVLDIPKKSIDSLSKEGIIKSIEKGLDALPIENVETVIENNFRELSKTQFSRLQRLEHFLYSNPFLRVPLFIVVFFILGIIIRIIFSQNLLLKQSLSVLLMFLTTAYIIFFIVHMVRRTLRSLFTAQNLIGLFVSYMLFIISILLLFTFLYSAAESMHKGYLTYSQCSQNFNPVMIENDAQKSTEYFYFSAVTFFTIGYGDICPMGMAKNIAILNGFVGIFVNAILMVVVVSMYIERSRK